MRIHSTGLRTPGTTCSSSVLGQGRLPGLQQPCGSALIAAPRHSCLPRMATVARAFESPAEVVKSLKDSLLNPTGAGALTAQLNVLKTYQRLLYESTAYVPESLKLLAEAATRDKAGREERYEEILLMTNSLLEPLVNLAKSLDPPKFCSMLKAATIIMALNGMNMLRPEEIIVPMTGSAEKKRQMDYAKRTSDAWYKLDTTLRQLVGRALPDAMRGAEVEQYLDVLNAMETLKLPDLAQVEMAKQLLSRMGDSRFLQQCKDIRVLVKVCQGVARLPGGRGMHHVTPELMKQLKGTVRRLAGLSYGDSIEESEPSNQQQQIRVGRSPTKGGKGGSQQQEQSGSKGKVHVSLKKGQQSQRSSTSIPDLRCAPDQLAVMLSWMLDAGTPQESQAALGHMFVQTAWDAVMANTIATTPAGAIVELGVAGLQSRWWKGLRSDQKQAALVSLTDALQQSSSYRDEGGDSRSNRSWVTSSSGWAAMEAPLAATLVMRLQNACESSPSMRVQLPMTFVSSMAQHAISTASGCSGLHDEDWGIYGVIVNCINRLWQLSSPAARQSTDRGQSEGIKKYKADVSNAARQILMYWTSSSGRLGRAGLVAITTLPALANTAGSPLKPSLQNAFETELLKRDLPDNLGRTFLCRTVLVPLALNNSFPSHHHVLDLCLPAVDDLYDQMPVSAFIAILQGFSKAEWAPASLQRDRLLVAALRVLQKADHVQAGTLMETVVEIMSRGVAPKQLTRKEGLMYDPVGSLTTPDAKEWSKAVEAWLAAWLSKQSKASERPDQWFTVVDVLHSLIVGVKGSLSDAVLYEALLYTRGLVWGRRLVLLMEVVAATQAAPATDRWAQAVVASVQKAVDALTDSKPRGTPSIGTTAGDSELLVRALNSLPAFASGSLRALQPAPKEELTTSAAVAVADASPTDSLDLMVANQSSGSDAEESHEEGQGSLSAQEQRTNGQGHQIGQQEGSDTEQQTKAVQEALQGQDTGIAAAADYASPDTYRAEPQVEAPAAQEQETEPVPAPMLAAATEAESLASKEDTPASVPAPEPVAVAAAVPPAASASVPVTAHTGVLLSGRVLHVLRSSAVIALEDAPGSGATGELSLRDATAAKVNTFAELGLKAGDLIKVLSLPPSAASPGSQVSGEESSSDPLVLSTRELEPWPGAMLTHPHLVYERAEQAYQLRCDFAASILGAATAPAAAEDPDASDSGAAAEADKPDPVQVVESLHADITAAAEAQPPASPAAGIGAAAAQHPEAVAAGAEESSVEQEGAVSADAQVAVLKAAAAPADQQVAAIFEGASSDSPPPEQQAPAQDPSTGTAAEAPETAVNESAPAAPVAATPATSVTVEVETAAKPHDRELFRQEAAAVMQELEMAVLRAAARALAEALADLVLQDVHLNNLQQAEQGQVTAFAEVAASLRVIPGATRSAEWLEKYEAVLQDLLPKVTPVTLARLLPALVHLGHVPSLVFTEVLAKQVQPHLSALASQDPVELGALLGALHTVLVHPQQKTYLVPAAATGNISIGVGNRGAPGKGQGAGSRAALDAAPGSLYADSTSKGLLATSVASTARMVAQAWLATTQADVLNRTPVEDLVPAVHAVAAMTSSVTSEITHPAMHGPLQRVDPMATSSDSDSEAAPTISRKGQASPAKGKAKGARQQQAGRLNTSAHPDLIPNGAWLVRCATALAAATPLPKPKVSGRQQRESSVGTEDDDADQGLQEGAHNNKAVPVEENTALLASVLTLVEARTAAQPDWAGAQYQAPLALRKLVSAMLARLGDHRPSVEKGIDMMRPLLDTAQRLGQVKLLPMTLLEKLLMTAFKQGLPAAALWAPYVVQQGLRPEAWWLKRALSTLARAAERQPGTIREWVTLFRTLSQVRLRTAKTHTLGLVTVTPPELVERAAMVLQQRQGAAGAVSGVDSALDTISLAYAMNLVLSNNTQQQAQRDPTTGAGTASTLPGRVQLTSDQLQALAEASQVPVALIQDLHDKGLSSTQLGGLLGQYSWAAETVYDALAALVSSANVLSAAVTTQQAEQWLEALVVLPAFGFGTLVPQGCQQYKDGKLLMLPQAALQKALPLDYLQAEASKVVVTPRSNSLAHRRLGELQEVLAAHSRCHAYGAAELGLSEDLLWEFIKLKEAQGGVPTPAAAEVLLALAASGGLTQPKLQQLKSKDVHSWSVLLRLLRDAWQSQQLVPLAHGHEMLALDVVKATLDTAALEEQTVLPVGRLLAPPDAPDSEQEIRQRRQAIQSYHSQVAERAQRIAAAHQVELAIDESGTPVPQQVGLALRKVLSCLFHKCAPCKQLTEGLEWLLTWPSPTADLGLWPVPLAWQSSWHTTQADLLADVSPTTIKGDGYQFLQSVLNTAFRAQDVCDPAGDYQLLRQMREFLIIVRLANGKLMLKLLNQEHYRKQATVDDIQAIFNVALADVHTWEEHGIIDSALSDEAAQDLFNILSRAMARSPSIAALDPALVIAMIRHQDMAPTDGRLAPFSTHWALRPGVAQGDILRLVASFNKARQTESLQEQKAQQKKVGFNHAQYARINIALMVNLDSSARLKPENEVVLKRYAEQFMQTSLFGKHMDLTDALDFMSSAAAFVHGDQSHTIMGKGFAHALDHFARRSGALTQYRKENNTSKPMKAFQTLALAHALGRGTRDAAVVLMQGGLLASVPVMGAARELGVERWETEWRRSGQQLRSDATELVFECGVPVHDPTMKELLTGSVFKDVVEDAIRILQSADGPATAAAALRPVLPAEHFASASGRAEIANAPSLVTTHSITTQVLAGGGGPAASRFPEVWAWALTYGAAAQAGEPVPESTKAEAVQGLVAAANKAFASSQVPVEVVLAWLGPGFDNAMTYEQDLPSALPVREWLEKADWSGVLQEADPAPRASASQAVVDALPPDWWEYTSPGNLPTYINLLGMWMVCPQFHSLFLSVYQSKVRAAGGSRGDQGKRSALEALVQKWEEDTAFGKQLVGELVTMSGMYGGLKQKLEGQQPAVSMSVTETGDMEVDLGVVSAPDMPGSTQSVLGFSEGAKGEGAKPSSSNPLADVLSGAMKLLGNQGGGLLDSVLRSSKQMNKLKDIMLSDLNSTESSSAGHEDDPRLGEMAGYSRLSVVQKRALITAVFAYTERPEAHKIVAGLVEKATDALSSRASDSGSAGQGAGGDSTAPVAAASSHATWVDGAIIWQQAAANLMNKPTMQWSATAAPLYNLMYSALPPVGPDQPSTRLHVMTAAALFRTFFKELLLEEVEKQAKAQASLRSHPITSGGSRKKGSR